MKPSTKTILFLALTAFNITAAQAAHDNQTKLVTYLQDKLGRKGEEVLKAQVNVEKARADDMENDDIEDGLDRIAAENIIFRDADDEAKKIESYLAQLSVRCRAWTKVNS